MLSILYHQYYQNLNQEHLYRLQLLHLYLLTNILLGPKYFLDNPYEYLL
nr:MAG TPA: hypothetical protein [Bacteriophage sp.]